ncbi:protein FAM111A-like isoform X2 [Poecilia formosa]|uniref:protein FAM111A-like isoform X2 n=1 Tax=Poecilia formosa TaxID=48698 RepID=UPI00044462D8|nr:PREDICTED: protein FAM111A-like isoform X2 [Poecilia formosa]
MIQPCRTAALQSASTSQLKGFKTRSQDMMKTPTKRTQTENKMDKKTGCDKENIDPGNDSSPPRKRWRACPGFQVSDGLQSQTRPPLGTRDSNDGSSLVKPRPHPTVREKKRTAGEQRFKQDQLPYRRKYKTCSPTNKRETELMPLRGVSGSVSESENVPPGCESETLGKKYLENSECRNDPENEDFLKLKEWVESRFPVCTFEKPLQMKEENFEMIQRSFTEFCSTGTQLVNPCQSVFYVEIWETGSDFISHGTGFVLGGNIVLTCFHLFKHWEKRNLNSLLKNLNINVEFNFNNLAYKSKKTFQAKWRLGIRDVDVALLELIYENRSLTQAELEEIPPGLLKIFGPVPGGDERACIVGYPAGRGRKTIDFTFIIRKEDREQAVTCNLMSKNSYLAVFSFLDQLHRDPNRDNYVTYNTSMYQGSSGSPVFDIFGRVFGLHIGGLYIDNPIPSHGVMGCAFSVLEIVKKLLGELQKNGMEDLLQKVLVVAERNPYLEEILESAGLRQTKVQALCVENQGKTDETGKQSESEEEMDTS